MFIQCFLLGFAVTAIPGAVFFEVIRRTLTDKYSIRNFLFGSFSGTFLIIGAVFLGLSTLLTDESLAKVFYLLSAMVLIYVGLASFVNAPGPKKIKKTRESYRAFVTGFVLGSANPISILFWIATIGKLLQTDGSLASAGLNSLFILLGAVSVYVILIPLVSYSQNIFKAKNIQILSRVFGAIILIYGCLTLSKVI